MSIKGKVKSLNKKIKELQEELQTYQLSNNRLRNKSDRLKVELEGQDNDGYKPSQFFQINYCPMCR